MSDRYRVLVTCGNFEPGFRGGGPIRSVARIVDTVPTGIECTLVTSDRDLNATEPYPGLSGRWVRRNENTRVFYRNSRDPRHWLALWRELRAVHFDLLYLNSLWSPIDTVVPILGLRLKLIRARVVLLAPRGELSPGALAIKAWKKRMFLGAWQRVLRHTNVVWHACAEREAEEIRAVCPWANVEVNGDMVALPPEPLPPIIPGPSPRLVFIGRISPKKNVLLILEALAETRQQVSLDIFGPVEDQAYWSRCLRLMDRMTNVRYRGELPPARVPDTFAQYDAFVFPTHGENFGHVIAESLYASCPVICSDHTPWSSVLKAGGGFVLAELTRACLADALESVARSSIERRLAARRDAGRAYQAWWWNHQPENVIVQLRRQRTPESTGRVPQSSPH